MNFFNITNKEELESFESPEDFLDLLIKKGVFIYSNEIDLDINEINIKLKPTRLFKLDFFNFIIKHYASYIRKGLFDFFVPFENKSFGKKELIYDLALEDFNEIFIALKLKNIVLTKVEKTANDIDHHSIVGRMPMVKFGLNAMAENFSKDENILMEYLLGNIEFFNNELIVVNEVLSKAFKRYINLKILIELNDKFNFEKSEDFGKTGYINDIHDKFRDITADNTLFHYIYTTIDNLTDDEKANISSLYCALIKTKKIDTKPKRFMEFIKINFQISISKLHNPYAFINKAHDGRMLKYSSKILDLDV
ncbi:hypothetical protein ADIWIN_2457 [Winogradskyella psychrotolerans RS-3]|uniref:Uncharacterized protein n=1 Tax=Winogradskyella psychrotolerans RS-3 TaxID=641526 RepID=S7VT78_9FLAO|nr:hypothetical protein [Winogradskyella psychrotolerans]EPR72567.1 hypothetical protein ADIWIN_2457 [Winogradskyella psychrotolerans RS-3]